MKRRACLATLAAMAIFTASAAQAITPWTGADLLEMSKGDASARALLAGYVAGITDADELVRITNPSAASCIPAVISPSVVASAVAAYVEKTDHVRKEAAHWVVRYVASHAWPCERKQP